MSRDGSSTGSLNTTNLIKHLQKQYGKGYNNFVLTTRAKTKSQTPQRTLQETVKQCQKLPPDSNKAKLITQGGSEFISLVEQSLSVVENVRF